MYKQNCHTSARRWTLIRNVCWFSKLKWFLCFPNDPCFILFVKFVCVLFVFTILIPILDAHLRGACLTLVYRGTSIETRYLKARGVPRLTVKLLNSSHRMYICVTHESRNKQQDRTFCIVWLYYTKTRQDFLHCLIILH